MEEVAGVLVGDTQSEWFERLQRGGEAEAREKFRDVANFCLEALRPARVPVRCERKDDRIP